VKNVVTPTTREQQQKQSSNQKAPVQVQSATFSALAQSKRTSTSWFCYYSQVPALLAKARHVLGIPTLKQMEEPQIVRYRSGKFFCR
jgi:prolyl 4-hydroxylase